MSKPPPMLPPPLRKQEQESETSVRLSWLIAVAALLGLLLSIFLLVWLLSQNEVGQGTTAGTAGGSTSRVVNLDADKGQMSATAVSPSAVSEPASKEEETEAKEADSSPESDLEPAEEPAESMVDGVSDEEPVLLMVEQKPSPKAPRSGSMGTGASSKVLATREGVNPFLGTGSPAKSTVYVIDVSGSMQTTDRLPRVLSALKRAIDQLKPEQSFMIILFDDFPYFDHSSNGLISASRGNIDKVYEWLDMPQGGGGTNPLPSMLSAIQLKPERIVLLSDGEFDPSVVYTISQANRLNSKPAKIDCVGLMEEVEVLKQIAASNEGIYYQAN